MSDILKDLASQLLELREIKAQIPDLNLADA